MKKATFVLTATAALLGHISFGQIISQFKWDANPVTAATVGPNAISASHSSKTHPGGVGGTKGLSAGTPKTDLDFVIPGSSYFDVSGIDVRFDYQREESDGIFFSRGNSLIIGGPSALSVSYRVSNGIGGFTTVSSGNVYNIPNDDIYRTYRFVYLPTTGEGKLLVNGNVVWSNNGPNNRSLYWTGSGNIIVGSGMDGNGNGNTFLDNLIIAKVTVSPLPIELSAFDAQASADNTVNMTWETASERNNDYFTIQRSEDGVSWENIASVDGAGTSSTALSYEGTDYHPYGGTSYYRLKQTDFDGEYTYSDIRAVTLGQSKTSESSRLTVYPNPATTSFTLDGAYNSSVLLVNSAGEVVPAVPEEQGGRLVYNVSDLTAGTYYLNIVADGISETKAVSIVK